MPKSQPAGLFEDEEYVDIDKINWGQILADHNMKFGEIKWFSNNSKFYKFRDNIDLALRFWRPYKYKAIIDVIKLALKFGLKQLEIDNFEELNYFHSIVKQVNNEIILATGYINLIPVSRNNDKFLLGDFNEESLIGDLVIKKLQHKYFGYNIVLKSSKYIYLSYFEQISILDIKKLDTELSLSKLLEQLYAKNFVGIKDKNEDSGLGLSFMSIPGLSFG